MSLQDRLTLSYLKRTHKFLIEDITIKNIETPDAEEIQDDSLYKIDDSIHLSFKPTDVPDVWTFFLTTDEGTEEIGKVYKTAENIFTSRAKDINDFEFTNKTMVDSALDICTHLGKI